MRWTVRQHLPRQHTSPGPCSDPSEGTKPGPQVTAGATDHDRGRGLLPLPRSSTEGSLGSGSGLLIAKARVYELSDDAERVVTPILIMTSRKKVFTVFGLMFIRCAISLLVSPSARCSTASISRSVS